MFICPKCQATNLGNNVQLGCECCGYMSQGWYNLTTTSGGTQPCNNIKDYKVPWETELKDKDNDKP